MLGAIYEAGWFHNLGIGVMVWGLLYIWLGLSGGRDGRRVARGALGDHERGGAGRA